MASLPCSKPVEQTNHHVERSTVVCHKTTTQTCHKANTEHSLTNKVKEMANSACKMFTEHKHQEHQGQTAGHHSLFGHHGQHDAAKTHTSVNHQSHASGHVQQSACQGSHLNAANTAATDKKNKEGHGGNFIANIGEHIKNIKNKRHRKAGKCTDARSDSSSSSDDESAINKLLERRRTE